MTVGGEPPRYRFGPRSTRGLIAGWSGGQIVSVALGALVALGLMRAVGGLAGVTLALLAAGAGVAAATWPIAGRPIEAWLPVLARHGAGVAADARSAPWLPVPRRVRSSPLWWLEVTSGPGIGERDIGLLEDREAGTLSGVLPVGGSGYALLDDSGRAAAVSAWAGVLSAMAAESRELHRLQWVARTFPAGARVAQLRRGALAASEDSMSPGAHATSRLRALPVALSSYDELGEELAPHLWARETFLVVTVRSVNHRVRARQGRSGDRPDEQVGVLLELLSSQLTAVGLVPGLPLSAAELAGPIRRSFELDPDSRHGSLTGPIGVERRWSALRTDASWHATYWVAEWPRGEVGPGVLLPLLLGAGHRRTVSLTMAPLPPVDARRRAERERTSGAADAELRRRHGFAMTARARAEQEQRHQHESELAEGHAAYLFSGYVSVTAPDEDSLERCCSEVEQAGALAQLELRRLFGVQEEGWCCTLPVGRGCR